MFYVKIWEERKGKKDIDKGIVYFDTKDNAIQYLEDYVMRDNNYVDMKALGNEKIKLVKFGYDLVLQVVQE